MWISHLDIMWLASTILNKTVETYLQWIKNTIYWLWQNYPYFYPLKFIHSPCGQILWASMQCRALCTHCRRTLVRQIAGRPTRPSLSDTNDCRTGETPKITESIGWAWFSFQTVGLTLCCKVQLKHYIDRKRCWTVSDWKGRNFLYICRTGTRNAVRTHLQHKLCC